MRTRLWIGFLLLVTSVVLFGISSAYVSSVKAETASRMGPGEQHLAQGFPPPPVGTWIIALGGDKLNEGFLLNTSTGEVWYLNPSTLRRIREAKAEPPVK